MINNRKYFSALLELLVIIPNREAGTRECLVFFACEMLSNSLITALSVNKCLNRVKYKKKESVAGCGSVIIGMLHLLHVPSSFAF